MCCSWMRPFTPFPQGFWMSSGTAGIARVRPVIAVAKDPAFQFYYPENLEVILTGNTPSQKMIDAADYVSEIRKIKHPFEKGQRARKGIEL